MQDKPKSGVAQDRHDQGMVLIHVVHNYPTNFRLGDLVSELGTDPDDFGERDRIERAVSDLVRVGLLFRCSSLVLPTLAALRFYEVLVD